MAQQLASLAVVLGSHDLQLPYLPRRKYLPGALCLCALADDQDQKGFHCLHDKRKLLNLGKNSSFPSSRHPLANSEPVFGLLLLLEEQLPH